MNYRIKPDTFGPQILGAMELCFRAGGSLWNKIVKVFIQSGTGEFIEFLAGAEGSASELKAHFSILAAHGMSIQK